VKDKLNASVTFPRPFVRRMDIKRFTDETWEKELDLFDSRHCTDEKKDIKKKLTSKRTRNDYHRFNLYVKDQLSYEGLTNSKSILYSTMCKARRDEWEFRFLRGRHDKGSSTMVFHDEVGGNGTEGHLDWSQARNIMFGFERTVGA
jgi:hypothetical protein